MLLTIRDANGLQLIISVLTLLFTAGSFYIAYIEYKKTTLKTYQFKAIDFTIVLLFCLLVFGIIFTN